MYDRIVSALIVCASVRVCVFVPSDQLRHILQGMSGPVKSVDPGEIRTQEALVLEGKAAFRTIVMHNYAATAPVLALASDYMRSPVIVSATLNERPGDGVIRAHFRVVDVGAAQKLDELVRVVVSAEVPVAVCVTQRVDSEAIVLRLRAEGHRVMMLQGGTNPGTREVS